MKSEGRNVISFAAGEPDFDTPDSIIDAADFALRHGVTKYTPSRGTQELREAICEKLSRENNVAATPDQIVVSCGAKHSLFNALLTTINPGDEVIIITPYWMTYADQVLLAGGVPVFVPSMAEDNFSVNAEAIAKAITKRTKSIILNSPNNPTGAVISRETIVEIASLAENHDFWIISDEIYDRLVYAGEHISVASLSPEVAKRTVHIGGCSKTYAMTGWRIGFACAPPPLATLMSNLQDQVTSNPTSFAQAGAVQAFRTHPSEIAWMRDEFAERRDLMVSMLNEIPGVKVAKPQGAFYCFADFRDVLEGKQMDDCKLADFLLEAAEIAMIPGSVFGSAGFLRFTYANSRENIQRGLTRLAQCAMVSAS